MHDKLDGGENDSLEQEIPVALKFIFKINYFPFRIHWLRFIDRRNTNGWIKTKKK